jgi:hypothetical protein
LSTKRKTEARWKQDVAILGALAAIDEDLAVLEVHIAYLDVDEFAAGRAMKRVQNGKGRPIVAFREVILLLLLEHTRLLVAANLSNLLPPPQMAYRGSGEQWKGSE